MPAVEKVNKTTGSTVHWAGHEWVKDPSGDQCWFHAGDTDEGGYTFEWADNDCPLQPVYKIYKEQS